ncbi:hypothetical protein EfmE1162_1835 [Enterococcus faecium E1162]|nr:hypothetical protein EfmE1162_1835 [Enterococcus faecium E1162]
MQCYRHWKYTGSKQAPKSIYKDKNIETWEAGNVEETIFH